MKYSLDILNDYLNRGLLEVNTHPTLPLSIWNYSRECQYSQAWDDITLNMRGTILDSEGNIVASSFPKFFNYEELNPEQIPNQDFDIYEKMDGSLGILFNYENEWIIATRGSFTSPQAIKAKELLEKYPLDRLDKNNTYLFEIIY
jgi:RNA ligase